MYSPRLWEVQQQLLKLNSTELTHVERYVRELQGKHSDTIEERVAHKDGYLQNEYRHTAKGTRRGPYWYFYWFEGAKQRRVYIGKCGLEEAKRRVEEKR